MTQRAPSATLKLPRQALPTLKKSDPKIARLVDRVGGFAMPPPKTCSHLEALCRSIVYQQLSGKAAATIFGRFRALWPEPDFPSPQNIVSQSTETLRACGLSGQKVSYLLDLCQKLLDDPRFLDDVDDLDDEAVISRLTSVRGLGRWSAEMFLMFHLGRLDVWPTADLGVRKAVQRLHNLSELPSPKEMAALGASYAPYRSVASWYLWRSLELSDEVSPQP
jgi:3-methyladenine DNA glycosylase/8-oxoguanine DNA glycosylase